jgi:hypothetical protein
MLPLPVGKILDSVGLLDTFFGFISRRARSRKMTDSGDESLVEIWK